MNDSFLRRAGLRLGRIAAVVTLTLTAVAMMTGPASASGSRKDAIVLLDKTRDSVDQTLLLLKQGNTAVALEEARTGYLAHFEQVEIPLRIADNKLTIEAEARFALIRQAIKDGRPVPEVRAQIVVLRDLLSQAERKLTDAGVGGPALVASQSFLILFREGFEVVLLLSVLLGFLEAARSPHLMKPILVGVGLAGLATVVTVAILPTLFSVLPVGREVLEAITALIAVAMLFYVSFWLIARMEHKRWMEFVRARLWSAISVGSTASLVAVGFTAVYREGFETALFYQSLLTFGTGLGRFIALGIGLALVALAGVAYAVFRLGRKLPIKTFMNTAVALVMVTSVAFLGNAMHTLQAADVLTFRRTTAPRLPIFLAEATGVWNTVPSLLAQAALSLVYVAGAAYVFVVKPRLGRPITRPTSVPGTLVS